MQGDARARHDEPGTQFAVAGAALIALIALAAAAGGAGGGGARAVVLALIGGGLGLALYHGAFGFTSGWRAALVRGDVRLARAQVLMIALAAVLFAPVLARGTAFGQGLGGALAPVDAGLAVGAFLFGIGMQLGGGCGSGTLYTVGGGSLRMVVTLIFFCLGGFAATLHFDFWRALPATGEMTLSAAGGTAGGLALTLVLLGALWLALGRLARARGGPATLALARRGSLATHALRGPWPLVAAAAALAVLNFATLVVAGHPWSITWGFTLWGAKAAAALGWDPAASAFWATGFGARALAAPVLEDVTSLMDLAIVAGAALGAGLAGRFHAGWRIAPGSLAAAVVGGLLLGYGARLAYGCNIGALFSGIASQSLHGWVWLACALPGTWVGVRLRPLFGLED